MVLSSVALSILRGNKPLWEAARGTLGVGKDAMYKYVKHNSSELTKAGVLRVLREGTGLTDEALLEEEKDSVKA